MKRTNLYVTEQMDSVAGKLALKLGGKSGLNVSKPDVYRLALMEMAKKEKVA